MNKQVFFLSNNKILYNHHSRFWKNHSENSSLEFLYDKILKGFDKSLMTGVILLDLQKEFDTTGDDILLKKIGCYWFLKSYY